MEILINQHAIEVNSYKLDDIEERRLIILDFKVTHEEYHDVTTLLYENNFDVKVPNEDIEFQATIQNYWTSFTNLYKEGAVGDFHVELIEK